MVSVKESASFVIKSVVPVEKNFSAAPSYCSQMQIQAKHNGIHRQALNDKGHTCSCVVVT